MSQLPDEEGGTKENAPVTDMDARPDPGFTGKTRGRCQT